MKGISGVIVVILLLLISLSLVAFSYIFFTQLFSTTTIGSEEAMSTTVERMLAELKIESINTTSNEIYIRNTGKVDLTQFVVYKNNIKTGCCSSPRILKPGESEIITDLIINSSDLIKVTTAQGAIAIQIAP